MRASNDPIGGGGGLAGIPSDLLERVGLGAVLPGAPDPSKRLRGSVVLVTGASSGIGEQASRQLAARGATVATVARSGDELERIAEEIAASGAPGSAHPYACDLTDLDAIDALVDRVIGDLGRVDVLVNNAGRSIRRSAEKSADRFHDFERTMQLNYFGAVRLILRLLPSMRENGGGQVINISSSGVQVRTPRFSGYLASKAALETFSDAVQGESRHEGIRFTTISMPLVKTPMISPTAHYDSFPALDPERAGEIIVEAVAARPRRVAPPYAHLVSLIDAISPEIMDLLRSRAYRMFPEG
jgi:NAD(P)-dependent dehydrogenase (short-subunit alcohol dehydrogenase family)